jgi:hypothetical protein
MNNNKCKYLIIILLFFLFAGNNIVFSQSTDKEGITLTWKDLQELLNLNANKIDITWEGFRKLLKQTGARMDMVFEIKDGIVTIKREQFRQILKKMKPVEKIVVDPPKDYIITEAEYYGTAGNKNSNFTAIFKIYVFERKNPVYINIPIIHTHFALKDIRVNKKPALIYTRGTWHNIILNRKGLYQVKAVFSIGNNKQSLYLPVIRSNINRLDFTVFKNNLEINVDPSINVKRKNMSNKTQIHTNFPPTSKILINWTRRTEKREKQPPFFYANTRSLISVEADILRVKTRVNLDIIQSTLDRVSLVVPENYEVIKIDGVSDNEWWVRKTTIGRVLEIHFRYDVDRTIGFTVYAERMMTAETIAADFTGFKVIEARRETGDMGIVSESSVQVNIDEKDNSGLEKIEFHKLPKGFLHISSRPILSAFKYIKHPYKLLVRITKHDRVEGISTVIESADITSLFLKEGKMIYHISYRVLNTYKQFMELELPKDSIIWTVYVDNKRGKASSNKKGKVLIPLIRSSGNGENIRPFNVELIYTLPIDKFRIMGKGECFIPSCDIFINKMRVSLHIPRGYGYNFDKTGWEEEKLPDSRQKRKEDISRISSFEEKSDKYKQIEEAIGDESEAPLSKKTDETVEKSIERGVSGGVVAGELTPPPSGKVQKKPRARIVTGPVGLSSIKVYLPLSGIRFVFSKKIVDKDEKFSLRFSYFSQWLKTGIIYLFVFMIVIGIAMIIRRKFKTKV